MATHKFVSDYYIIREAHRVEENGNIIQKFETLDLASCVENLLGKDLAKYPLLSQRETALDTARLQRMVRDEYGIYEFQFLRLRDHIQPEIATPDGQLRTYHLEKGEQPAESASALYDPLTHVFVLQHSHFGANATFIRAFLNELFFDHALENVILLSPLAKERIRLSDVLRRRIRQFTARLEYENKRVDMCTDMQHFSPLRPAQVEFTVKTDLRRKDTELEQEQVAVRLQELHGDPHTSKLDVVVEGIGRGNEVLKLLDETMKDKFTVNMPSATDLVRHSDVYPLLKKEYLNRVRLGDDDRFEARQKELAERAAL